MKQVGTIKMRMPNGKRSSISVSVTDNGAIDVRIFRTAEGEALLRMPRFSAGALGELLIKASALTEG